MIIGFVFVGCVRALFAQHALPGLTKPPRVSLRGLGPSGNDRGQDG